MNLGKLKIKRWLDYQIVIRKVKIFFLNPKIVNILKKLKSITQIKQYKQEYKLWQKKILKIKK